MKFRVINLRNISNYLLKIVLLVIIVIILSIGLYYNKNVDASAKFNSSRLSKIINKEITLFGSLSNNDNNINSNISEYTIGKEFGMLKIANLKNSSLNSYGNNLNNIDAGIENENQGNTGMNENEQNSKETAQAISNAVEEPAVRAKYRSASL